MDDRRKCTVALARPAGDAWEIVGGGIGLVLEDCALALSAGHLLRQAGAGLWLGAGGAMVRLRGVLTLGQEPYAPREIRQLDIGFAPLLPDDLEDLAALELVTPLVVDLEDAPPGADYLAIAPADRTGIGGRVLAAREVPQELYSACRVDVATHLVVDLAEDVDVAGLVGAGVWRPAPGPAGDRLTGVVVDVRSVDSGRTRLIATRAGLVLWAVMGALGHRPSPWSGSAAMGRRPGKPKARMVRRH